MKHTPGKWQANISELSAGSPKLGIRATQTGYPWRNTHICDTQPHNANLIAAAPDLLQALKDLLSAFDTTCAAGKSGVAPSQASHWREKARNLIAKVEGAE